MTRRLEDWCIGVLKGCDEGLVGCECLLPGSMVVT